MSTFISAPVVPKAEYFYSYLDVSSSPSLPFCILGRSFAHTLRYSAWMTVMRYFFSSDFCFPACSPIKGLSSALVCLLNVNGTPVIRLNIPADPNGKLSYNKPAVERNTFLSDGVLNFGDSGLPAKIASPINHKAHYFIQTRNTPWSKRFNQAASHQSPAPVSRTTRVMAVGLWFVETI